MKETQTFTEYGYHNGNTEKAFSDVMNIQKNYDFLGHNEKTSSAERKKIMGKIAKRLNKMKATMVAVMVVISMVFTSCDKDFNNDKPAIEKIMVTQNIRLTSFDITAIESNTKSWDNSFLGIWNPSSYDLNFVSQSDPSDNVTINTTIQQLKDGMSVEIYEGLYDVDFLSLHTYSSTAGNQLDGSIDMLDLNIMGTPINLIGAYEDYLIVVDLQGLESIYFLGNDDNKPEFIHITNGDYWYCYLNQGSIYKDFYVNYPFDEGIDFNITLSGTNGNCYHYLKSIDGVTILTFPDWNVIKISV